MNEARTSVERNRTKRVLLAIATAIFAFVGLSAWAIASPVGAAPDDDFHLASIWCALGERDGLCASGDAEDERTVSERLIESSKCFSHYPEVSAQCDVSDVTMISTDRGNFTGNYPPVFYSVLGIFSSPDIAVSTILMRVFNAAIFVGAVGAVLALLRPGQRGPILWTSVVALVPLGMFIIPSVNPSSWAVLAGLTVWAAVYGYYTADTRARRIALGAIGLMIGVMGAGARGDSAVFVGFAAFAAAILAFERGGRWLKLSILPLVLMVIGAFFFFAAGQSTGIANVAAEQAASGAAAQQAAGATETVQAAGAISPINLLIANALDLLWLWTGGTGTWGLGWLDTPVPLMVWVFMIGALFVIAMWGVRLMTKRKGLLLLLALLALTVLPLYILWGKNLRVGEWVQPRYLLPLLLIFLGLTLFGFAKDHLGITRLQAGIIFAGVTVANSLSLHNNMRRYISGLGDGGFNLNANVEWWWAMPVQPMTVWVLGSLAFALTLAGLFLWLYPKGERPAVPAAERSPELLR